MKKIILMSFLIVLSASTYFIAYRSGVLKNCMSLENSRYIFKCVYAELGDAESQYKMARAYQKGIFKNKDDTKSIYYYSLAANQGLAKAQNNLGSVYDKGDGVEKNNDKAIEWYLLAAKQNHLLAQLNLAEKFYLQKEYKKALFWFEKAAEFGDVKAQSMTASMYETSKGTDTNLEIAKYWYQKASDQEDGYAQFNLGRLYFDEGDYKEAFELFEKSSEKGTPQALNNMATMYESGKGVEKDLLQSGSLYREAMEEGLAVSESYLNKSKNFCVNFLKEKPVTKEQADACLIASGAGYVDAQKMLSILYYYGNILEKDPIKAMAWGLISNDKGRNLNSSIQATSLAIFIDLQKKLTPEETQSANNLVNIYKNKYLK